MQSCVFVGIVAGWSLINQVFHTYEIKGLVFRIGFPFLGMVASIFIRQFGSYDGHHIIWYVVADVLCWLFLIIPTLETGRWLQRSLHSDGRASTMGGLLSSFDKLVVIICAYSILKILLFVGMTSDGYKSAWVFVCMEDIVGLMLYALIFALFAPRQWEVERELELRVV